MRTGVADHCLTAWLLRHIQFYFERTITDSSKHCLTIISSSNDSDGNRTRVTAVKGRCLNRLTTEPNIVTQQKICYHNRTHLASTNYIIYDIFLLYDLNFPFLFDPSSYYFMLPTHKIFINRKSVIENTHSTLSVSVLPNSPSRARTYNPAVNSRVLYH